MPLDSKLRVNSRARSSNKSLSHFQAPRLTVPSSVRLRLDTLLLWAYHHAKTRTVAMLAG